MVRPKRNSPVLVQAEKREAGLKSIDTNLDLGNGLLLSDYSDSIQQLRDQLSKYNAMLSSLDELARDINASEKTLRDRSEQMLLGVAAKYGKDSNEYGKAGGTLKSERRRSTKKKAATVATSPTEESPVEAPATHESIQMLFAAPKSRETSTSNNGNGHSASSSAS